MNVTPRGVQIAPRSSTRPISQPLQPRAATAHNFGGLRQTKRPDTRFFDTLPNHLSGEGPKKSGFVKAFLRLLLHQTSQAPCRRNAAETTASHSFSHEKKCTPKKQKAHRMFIFIGLSCSDGINIVDSVQSIPTVVYQIAIHRYTERAKRSWDSSKSQPLSEKKILSKWQKAVVQGGGGEGGAHS